MYEGHTIGVVVPAYNEQDHVGEVIETIPGYVDRTYVIDDASTDDTWAEIRRRVDGTGGTDPAEMSVVAEDAPRPTVVPIRHAENRGVGGAITTGYRRARADDLDVTAVVAGDGQMDPDQLERLLDPIVAGEADYTKGDRLADPSHHADMPRFRYVGNRLLTVLTRIASGYWDLSDPQNGYTAISADALTAIDVERIYGYYGYCNDLLVKLHAEGLRVVDVPMPAEYGDETSHIDYSRYIPKVSWMLLGNFLWRLRREYGLVRHPAGAGYTAGLLGGTAGVGLSAAARRLEGGKRLLGPLLVAASTITFLAAAALEAARESSSTSPSPPPAADEQPPDAIEPTSVTRNGAAVPTQADGGRDGRNGDSSAEATFGHSADGPERDGAP